MIYSTHVYLEAYAQAVIWTCFINLSMEKEAAICMLEKKEPLSYTIQQTEPG